MVARGGERFHRVDRPQLAAPLAALGWLQSRGSCKLTDPFGGDPEVTSDLTGSEKLRTHASMVAGRVGRS